MVVPLIVLGIFAKLALAATIAHRTRLWWLPGATAIAVGTGTILLLHGHAMQVAGASSIVLGATALGVGRFLRRWSSWTKQLDVGGPATDPR
jgi:hypothetical protein